LAQRGAAAAGAAEVQPPSKRARAGPSATSVGNALVGREVRKEFVGFGVYTGVVKQYRPKKHWWVVQYTDGDTEELDRDGLDAVLVPVQAGKKQKVASTAAAEAAPEGAAAPEQPPAAAPRHLPA
jgi:hypothetical protein